MSVKTFLILSILLPSMAMAALIDPSLQTFARQPSGTAKVLVLMDFRPSQQMPTRDPRAVKSYLMNEVKTSWMRMQQTLAAPLASQDIRVTAVHSINQSFDAYVTPAGLRALATASGVTKVYADTRVVVMPPAARRPAPPRRFDAALPYDLTIMGLDKVAQTDPSLNGTGVLVGHIDTGVDGKHPALAGKIALFYNASQGRTTEPKDEAEHGTHTAGTIVGGPKDGLPMGVAPGARLVSVAGLTDYESMIKGMEFMLDPDGNPQTNDAPRLVSNSWNCGGAPDIEPFYRAISAWEAAGIMTVFSAGNAGPAARTITKPHEHPLSFSVAAFGPNGVIADFSSRGPGVFNGQDTQKPDVGAPGVDIVSSVPGGKFEAMSGTSMAAPHAAGLAALLFQLDPTLTPAKMRQILIQSSNYVDQNGRDIPQPMWNPVFGFGRLNAVKAVALVKQSRGQFDRRWGTLMAPALDLVQGLSAITSLSYGIRQQEVATELSLAFPTDSRAWIDGRSL